MVRVLSASFNPLYYDAIVIADMDYDKAKDFFKHDEIGCARIEEKTIDLKNPNELKFIQDGVFGGDTSDAMVVWIKVD